MIRYFQRMGRPGGFVLLLASIVLWALAVPIIRQFGPWNGSELWSPAATAIGIAFGVFGLVALFEGGMQVISPKIPSSLMESAARDSLEEFAVKVHAAERPFYACVRCRVVFARAECSGRCLECNSLANCMEVVSESDSEYVVASARNLG